MNRGNPVRMTKKDRLSVRQAMELILLIDDYFKNARPDWRGCNSLTVARQKLMRGIEEAGARDGCQYRLEDL